MNFEIAIYLIIASIFSAYRRILSGKKNGCFYGKNSNPLEPRLKKYILNLHFIETPAWYSQFGAVFLYTFAIFRLVHIEYEFWLIITQFIAAMFVTMGSSGMANYYFQGYINIGSGLPFLNEKENPKSEFAFNNIKFWWRRPWGGKIRKYIPYFGAISIIFGVWLGLKK